MAVTNVVCFFGMVGSSIPTLSNSLVYLILMIYIRQIYGIQQISTTGMSKIDVGHSWHALILPKLQNFKKVKLLTLSEIEFLIKLACQKFANYVPIMCTTRAKIVIRIIFVHSVSFSVVVRTFLCMVFLNLRVTNVMAQDFNLSEALKVSSNTFSS